MEMLRDNSITVFMSHRVHGFGTFISVCVARKKTGRRRGWMPRMKEEDTSNGGRRGGRIEGRRKVGGEREKIDGGKDGSLYRCTRVRWNSTTLAARKRRAYQRC